MSDLQRFIDAQHDQYSIALAEIRNGKKQSHWMWYIFPQVKGLGSSSMAQRFAIEDIDEAIEYLNHPLLAKRLIEISHALLALKTNDPYQVMGKPDNMKLRSSMTLFASIPGADPVFASVLEKYFNGQQDVRTLEIIDIGHRT